MPKTSPCTAARMSAICNGSVTGQLANPWAVAVSSTRLVADEIEEAERAQLLPWTATSKLHSVRVMQFAITGRRFRFGSEPDRESRPSLQRRS